MKDSDFEGVGKVVRHISFFHPQFLWGEGTGFFVLHGHDYFFLTARHNVFKDGKNLADSIMVADPVANICVPFDLMLGGGESATELNDDKNDFVIFRVNSALAAERGIEKIYAIDLEREAGFGIEIPDKTILRCAGYPTTENPYNWENREKSVHLLVKEGRKKGATLGVGTGTILGQPSRLDYSGMSGGPVFAAVNMKWIWVGIVIRASGSSGVVNYLSADNVLKVLQSGVSMFFPLGSDNAFAG